MGAEHHMKVTRKMNFGAVGQIEIELHGTKALDEVAGIVELNGMIEVINNYFNHIINEHLPKMKGAPLLEDGILVVSATSMYVKMDKRNKPFIAVKCGEWQEFGLPFYSENFKAQGITIEAVLAAGEGGHIFKDGTTCELLVQGGKAKKVVKIIAAKPS